MQGNKIKKYLQLAIDISKLSKDHHTKVGALIVGPDLEVRSIGFNWLPRGVAEKFERTQRPEKYKWTEHAERNAIYNAARVGTPLQGASLFVTMRPCPDCARAIIQSGIKQVYATSQESSSTDHKWAEDNALVETMLKEAGVGLKVLPYWEFDWPKEVLHPPRPDGKLTRLCKNFFQRLKWIFYEFV